MLHQLHSWNLRSIGGPATHLVDLRSARHGTKDAPDAADAPGMGSEGSTCPDKRNDFVHRGFGFAKPARAGQGRAG